MATGKRTQGARGGARLVAIDDDETYEQIRARLELATERSATAHAILVDLVALDVEKCTREDIRALVARARTALQ